MKVTLNQAALQALLETNEGPVGRHIEDRADRVALNARQNVRVIMFRSPEMASSVSNSVGYEIDSQNKAIVGIRETTNDIGKKRISAEQWLANKEAGLLAKDPAGRVWLYPALKKEFE